MQLTCSLAMTVRQLHSQMAVLQDGLSKVIGSSASVARLSASSHVSVREPYSVSEGTNSTSDAPGSAAAEDSCGQSSWVATAMVDAAKWNTVQKKVSSRPKPQFEICGSAVTNSDKIKSVPRVLAAYVGRLQKDTTEEDLTVYLSDVGMRGVVCKKLVSKDGKFYNTAAFYVTCSAESKDLFYNEACWLEGVEVRDWVYYSK